MPVWRMAVCGCVGQCTTDRYYDLSSAERGGSGGEGASVHYPRSDSFAGDGSCRHRTVGYTGPVGSGKTFLRCYRKGLWWDRGIEDGFGAQPGCTTYSRQL